MVRSHTPASRASTTPTGTPLDPEVAAENPAETPAETPADSLSPSLPRPVRWDDRADVRAWLSRARSHIAELAALAREGSRRGKNRVLSRAERSRQTRAAESSLCTLLDAADAGLLTLPAPRGEQGE